MNQFQIKIWGVRGSIPSPPSPKRLNAQKRGLLYGFFKEGYRHPSQIEEYIESIPDYYISGFGGNTTCVEVNVNGKQLIIDGGSGLRYISNRLMQGPCGQGKGEVHILFTHFHWDHLVGIPMFSPLLTPGNSVHFYAVQDELEETIQMLFRKPYFPVKYQADVYFHKLKPRSPYLFDDVAVTPYMMDHPDPCWGYRIEANDKVYSHAVDTECVRFTKEALGADSPFYDNVDLLLFDAQYTLLEAMTVFADYGHSSANLGLDLAMHRNIKKILFTHHSPDADTKRISEAYKSTQLYYQTQLRNAKQSGISINPVKWNFAQEGMVIDL